MDTSVSKQDYDTQLGSNKRRYEGDYAHFNIAPNSRLVLAKFLDTCRDRGIPAFLIEMPEADDFREMHTAAGDAELASWLAQIQGEYGVPLIDASTWIERRRFSDGHHLNAAGAAEFSRRFGDQLFKMAKAPPAQ
jgi:lysophospholipase L1-like esterase